MGFRDTDDYLKIDFPEWVRPLRAPWLRSHFLVNTKHHWKSTLSRLFIANGKLYRFYLFPGKGEEIRNRNGQTLPLVPSDFHS